jgi:hypothetical protein
VVIILRHNWNFLFLNGITKLSCHRDVKYMQFLHWPINWTSSFGKYITHPYKYRSVDNAIFLLVQKFIRNILYFVTIIVWGAGVAQWYRAGLQAGWRRAWVLAEAGNFSRHHRVQTGSGVHPASYPMGTRGSFPEGKAAGAWSWPPTST